jgi:acyl dehydratase
MNASHVGQTLPEVRIAAVDPAAMKVMTLLLRDSNPIHFDAEIVRRLGVGDRPVNQGPMNLGYVITMLARFAGGHERVRRLECRFLGNVFAGDEVVARGEVTSVADCEGCRLVTCDVWLDRADGQRVLDGNADVEVPA